MERYRLAVSERLARLHLSERQLVVMVESEKVNRMEVGCCRQTSGTDGHEVCRKGEGIE